MENQTETPPISCCSFKSRLICLSAGLVVLVIVAIASFVLGRALPRGPEGTLRGTPTTAILPTPTPTPDETADWKTYTNSKYGFSFKYPQEWNIGIPSFEGFEGKDESNKTLFRADITNSSDFKNNALLSGEKKILNISVSVWNNESARSFNSVLEEWDNFDHPYKIDTESIKEINQIKWTRRELTNTHPSALSRIEFAALNGKYLFVVTAAPRDSTIINSADQILSTFKFLD